MRCGVLLTYEAALLEYTRKAGPIRGFKLLKRRLP
jgi:hypothetical protein